MLLISCIKLPDVQSLTNAWASGAVALSPSPPSSPTNDIADNNYFFNSNICK